jgi:hypothetical protein
MPGAEVWNLAVTSASLLSPRLSAHPPCKTPINGEAAVKGAVVVEFSLEQLRNKFIHTEFGEGIPQPVRGKRVYEPFPGRYGCSHGASHAG